MELEKNKQPIKVHIAKKDHYGCPPPFTFSSNGILYNERNRNDPDWQESVFKFEYEFSFCRMRVFLDYFLTNKIYNFTSKSLREKALAYYEVNRQKLNIEL